MKTINLMNYHDIFSNNFNKEEREDFIFSYETYIRDISFYALHPDMTENPVNDFLKKWEPNFRNHELLLREILTLRSPKEIYAIMELCGSTI